MSKAISFATPGSRVEAATDFRLPGRQEQMVGRDGHFNASNKKDVLATLGALMDVVKSGTEVVTEEDASMRAKATNLRNQMVMAAFDDPKEHAALGLALTDQINFAANKQGFARKLLKRQELQQGQYPQCLMPLQNVAAIIATGPVQCETQIVRNNRYFPQEFYIEARPYIEQREIDQTNVDILNEKYLEALMGTMVQEDRTWRAMALQSVGIVNPATSIVGQLTPNGLAQVRTQLLSYRIGATNLVMAADLWNDIIGNSEFMSGVDPVTRHEIVLTGEIGKLLGMSITTDAYRHPHHQVLSQGEFWVVSDPDYHGQFTDRGGVSSAPIDITTERVPGRGWAMFESCSMIIANAASVAYATRTAS
jgi:hypothetical protein